MDRLVLVLAYLDLIRVRPADRTQMKLRSMTGKSDCGAYKLRKGTITSENALAHSLNESCTGCEARTFS